MKITSRRRWIVYIITCALLLTGVTVAVFNFSHNPAPVSPPPPTIKSEVPKKTTITIGSHTIPALEEDYRAPESLWVLFNKSNPLPDPNYTPQHLAKAPLEYRSGLSSEEQLVRSDIIQPLTDMFAAAKTANISLIIGSAYRSPTLQKFYFDSYTKRDGIEAAKKYSALPGQSEHQLGLVVDLSDTSRTCYLETCFEATAAGKWLASNAHKYGFLLRYPKDKEAITTYQYEPWHFRYVGKELATALHDNQLTLEEIQPQLTEARQQLKSRSKL